MQRYKCRDCAFSFSEVDRSWDSAIDSGRCPKCSQPLYDFPVPVRGHKVEPAVPLPPPSTHTPWKTAGNVTVIRCPVSKSKEKYEGAWSYEYGLMSRRILFKKEVVDLRKKLVKVELAPEFITVLAGYKKAAEVTPASLMLGLSMPVLVESYQERKRSTLSQMVLAVIYLNESWFYAYMNADIYVELMMHGEQQGRTQPAKS